MKKIKRLLTILLTFIMMMAFTVPVLADDYNDPRLIDGSGILSSSEAEDIEKSLDKVSKEYDFDVAICIIDDLPEGYSVEDFATRYIKECDFGYGTGLTDKCLLTVVMNSRDWCISACGPNEKTFNSWGRGYIGDKVKANGLSDGDYKEAFDEYIYQCERFIKQAKDGKPYGKGNYPKDYKKVILKRAIKTGVIGGLIITIIIMIIMYSNMKSVAKKTEAGHYVVPGSLNLTYANDVFLYSKVSRERKESNSSSSSSSSSGGVSHTSGKF